MFNRKLMSNHLLQGIGKRQIQSTFPISVAVVKTVREENMLSFDVGLCVLETKDKQEFFAFLSLNRIYPFKVFT